MFLDDVPVRWSRGIISSAHIQQVLMSDAPAEDYYTLLGLARDASPDEIKRRFRRLARECHPDVAGDSPDAVERFTRIRQAYETLSDPQKRNLYDNPPRRTAGGTFYRRSWRPPGGNRFDGLHNSSSTTSGAARSVRQRLNDPGNQLDLEDIFSDLGARGKPRPNTSSSNSSSRRRTPAPAGEDISLSVEVPDHIALSGGTVSVSYPRLKRGERGETLFRYSEIHELRVPTQTRHGASLRVARMGSAGAGGGPYGDLVCKIQIVPRARSRSGVADSHPEPEPVENDGDQVVSISVVEALLGGRVEVSTPGGRVRLTVPPGTSSGSRLRLRGRAAGGGDLFVRLRIVVPRALDDESRALIERFAALNPDTPDR
ncbi:MAG: DnaJ-class molecular chaperone [Myxococcota bacterium]|jgi:DnaJ-class molecular chaperone